MQCMQPLHGGKVSASMASIHVNPNNYAPLLASSSKVRATFLKQHRRHNKNAWEEEAQIHKARGKRLH